MAGKVFVIIILLIVISSGSMLFLKFPPLKIPDLNLSLPKLEDTSPVTTYDIPTPTPTSTTSPKPTTNPTKAPTIKPATQPVAPPPPKECYRYLITHLDGSTSNLCYSKANYDQLLNLGFQLSSAKTFYQFHLDGVARYQEEYERTGSSIYLDAKASQQSKADAEKTKIDQTNSQMYNLERQGY